MSDSNCGKRRVLVAYDVLFDVTGLCVCLEIVIIIHLRREQRVLVR